MPLTNRAKKAWITPAYRAIRRETCGACGAKEGEYHEWLCDIEECPFCGRQLSTCDCCYKLLGYNMDESRLWHGLPESVYHNGLSEVQEDRWIAILEAKGRVPFIEYPNLCAKCGERWPEMFKVPDEVWMEYISPGHQGKMLCKSCYAAIVFLIERERKENENR